MQKTHKFFYFEIKGDNLNLEAIANKVNLPNDVFAKGDKCENYSKKIVQKTNRWVYRDELLSETSISNFLTKNLILINNHLNELRYFIQHFKSRIELVIYADNKTDIVLSKKHIDLLKKIGTKLYISFC